MEQIVIKIKDKTKISFLLELIKQFDFVEIVKIKDKKNIPEYNFFDSAGLWSNRDVDAKDLRNKAWNRQK